MTVKHAFTSAAAEGGDATKVRTSNWNAAHVYSGISIVQSAENTGSPAADVVFGATPAQSSLMVLIGQNNGDDYSSITQTNATWTRRRADNVGGVGNLFIWTGVWDGSGTIGTTITLVGGSGGGSVFVVEVSGMAYSGLGANGLYAQQMLSNIKSTLALKGVPEGRLVCFIVHGAGAGVVSPAILSCPHMWCTVDSVGGLAFGLTQAGGMPITGYNATASLYYTLVDIVPS